VGSAPTNFAELDNSSDAIERDALYGIQVGQGYADWITNTPAKLAGGRVLELGPGTSYCGAIGLLGRGAADPVSVADRWLAPWRDNYHGPLYTRCSKLLREAGRAAEAKVFADIAAEGYSTRIQALSGGAENLPVESNSFDMVFSNAVLEHLVDHSAAARELYRVTAPGGWNFHQTDFRDHRNFERPLDHLLMSSKEWLALSEAQVEPHCFGTQLRAHAIAALFAEAGFDTFTQYHIEMADAEYASRIADQIGSDPEQIRVLCSLLILRKPLT
jgi:SAM-dependent methyltransferase